MTEEGSPVGRKLRRTGDLLLGGAEKQVQSYRTRFNKLVGCYDSFLSRLVLSYTPQDIDFSFIDSFFGKRNLRFAGIDGTIGKHPVFDLVIFFAGAYPAYGSIGIDDDGNMKLKYEEKYLERGIGVSSVLPIYVNEIPLVDQTILTRDEEGEIDDSIGYNDSWIIDNSAFADYLMGLSEFYLAYKLVNSDDPIDILLLDRTCSSEISSFHFETSDQRVNLDRESGLLGANIEGNPFTKTEWVLTRRLIGNSLLGTPPPRGEYMLPSIVALLQEEGSLSREEISQKLGIDNPSREARLDRELELGMRSSNSLGAAIVRKGDRFSLKSEIRDLYRRIRVLVEEVCERIFSEDPNITVDDRFKVNSRWLTTTDLAFLSLASLFLMMTKCWKNRTLLVGVAKDSSARDLRRQLLPVLNHVGLFEGSFSDYSEDTPDTDRMILQWVSMQERDKLAIPWATCEYDTAFKTIVPHFDRVADRVSGARRNQISLEKTFVKSYFQLCQAATDAKLRSNVLLYDRLVYPNFDDQESHMLKLYHDYTSDPAEPEPIELITYLEKKNPIQAFVVNLFACMTSNSIPDLFGHLKPLYIADKVAKYYYNQFDTMMRSARSWLFNKPELREFLFYLSSFRERRSDIEQTRRSS
ncbi:MAG: hypothetical protein JSW61_07705 [Candidatus Thorarchaeota archaeon]|nr:MAG: hypothetical protein JSW61_07705 [Candidatus Thorarchaeota archaeon]